MVAQMTRLIGGVRRRKLKVDGHRTLNNVDRSYLKEGLARAASPVVYGIHWEMDKVA